MSDHPRGRAQERARGRAREGTDGHQARPPGEPELAAAAPRHPLITSQEAQAQVQASASLWASFRGLARELPPGMASGEGPHVLPPEELGAMTIGTGEASDVGTRRRDFRYVEVRTRPAHITDKKGITGDRLPLITNYFKLERAPQWHLYQYHVDFNPIVDSKKMRISLLLQHENLLGKTRAFDGMVLFLPIRLQEQTSEVYSKRNTDDVNIRITITLRKELQPNSIQCIQVYNIIFRRVLAVVEMKQIGRNYYSPSLSYDIKEHNLKVLPGFITSIMKHENEVLLNCDISHKIIRTDSVLELMNQMVRRNERTFYDDAVRYLLVKTPTLVYFIVNATIQIPSVRSLANENDKDCLHQLLKETRHKAKESLNVKVAIKKSARYNNRTYRVKGIAWDKRPQDTFKLHDGSQISYKDYYKQSYEIDVHDVDQPLLVIKPSKKDIESGQEDSIYLLPELCQMTGLTNEARSDNNLMRTVSAYTRVNPTERAWTLTSFLKQVNSNENVRKEMGGWGLKFSSELLKLNGRILPQEKIMQREELSYKREEADWVRDMRGKQLITAIELRNWLIIVSSENSKQAQNFVQTLIRVGHPLGMRIAQPTLYKLNDDRNNFYLAALKDKVTPQIQLVMCIVPSDRKDRYDVIKKFTCVDRPVPSQVILTKTLNKKDIMPIATKVAIQLNCKLGGEVWTLEIPLSRLMVIGIDVFHDTVTKSRSVAGIVASMNTTLTKYYSRVTFQEEQKELIEDLTTPLVGAIRNYFNVNGSLPQCIIVFRDGVGDGQLQAVSEQEVSKMLDSFKMAGGQDYNPKVGVVIVKKRINSRFFAKAGEELINPSPGTIVDVEVTKPEWYDFFLVSQSVRQGTVSPTHYNVIYDTTEHKPDFIQRLSYKLCHLYYNWPGTISVPAPCQYAHKLAYLVGQSIHREPSLDLADKLYFL